MGSTKKTKEHVDKLKVGVTRGAMLLIRTEHLKDREKMLNIKDAWELYNIRRQEKEEGTKKRHKILSNPRLRAGIVGVVALSTMLFALQLKPLQTKVLNQGQVNTVLIQHTNGASGKVYLNVNPDFVESAATGQFPAWKHGYVSATSIQHTNEILGKVYIHVKPNSVKSVINESVNGSVIQKNVSNRDGLFSIQLNTTLEAITNKGKPMYFWVQNVTDIRRSKEGKVVKLQLSEIFALNSKDNSIFFTNLGNYIKGKGELYSTSPQYNGQPSLYMHIPSPKTLNNQKTLTINQTLGMRTGIRNGRVCINFTLHNNTTELVSKNKNIDTVCMGYRGEFKTAYFIGTKQNPAQLGIVGSAARARAIFPRNTQAYLEMLKRNDKGQILQVHYNTKNVLNQSGEISNLRINNINKVKGNIEVMVKKD